MVRSLYALQQRESQGTFFHSLHRRTGEACSSMTESAKTRGPDGSAGDADYGTIGAGYVNYRQPEPLIAGQIRRALGEALTVLNVGAGAGSYEPMDRNVTAVEPSVSMRAQRPPGLPAAIDA